MNKFRNQLSRLSCIQMVLVHRCPHCTRNAIGSLHDCVRRMNEHIGNKHNGRALTTDEFNALEVCEASKTGSKSSYLQVQEVVLSEGFRHESLFEVKAGLLKCNIVFFDGEQRSIGPECQRFFFSGTINPYFDEVVSFLSLAESLCQNSGSALCRQQAMRNCEGMTTTKTFSPIQSAAQSKYAATVASLAYFVTQCPWDRGSCDKTDIIAILSSILFEPQRTIQQNYMTRKFIQMSYVTCASGPSSRNAQFIVHQCVHILYAMRVLFLYHTLRVVHQSQVNEPERISSLFLNSRVASSFTAIQNIKRPAKLDIPEFGDQKITWVQGSNYQSLNVHSGPMRMNRVPVSHNMLRRTYGLILSRIVQLLKTMGINMITFEQFQQLRDSASSSRPGEGMMTFNPQLQESNKGFIAASTRESRLKFLVLASDVYRLSLAAVHLTGGPSPRGTEDAVTRLTNSSTELVRNVQLSNGTVGVASGYVVQRIDMCVYICVVHGACVCACIYVQCFQKSSRSVG